MALLWTSLNFKLLLQKKKKFLALGFYLHARGAPLIIGSNEMSHSLFFFLDLKADALARTNIKINMEKFLEVSPMMAYLELLYFSH